MLWLMLVALFLVTGAVGHDPWWKKGEAYSFGIIYHFYTTNSWLIPTNAGIPFMEKPPLYYWTATLFGDLFRGIFPVHDAARFASVFYMAVTTFFLWKSCRIFFSAYPQRRAMEWMGVTLFLGTYGISIAGHSLITDLALMAGTTIVLYGISLLYLRQEQWKKAGIWLGIGIGIAFLSKGFVMPVILGISGIILFLLSPSLHQANFRRALLLGCSVALPFLVIWPLLLYMHSPVLFMEWFWDNNIGRLLGFSVKTLGAENRRGHFLLLLPRFSFPIFPLACMEILAGRKTWRRPEYFVPVVISVVGVVLLFSSASFRNVYLLPLFPGLAVLATQAMLRIPARFLSVWNNVVRVGFTIWAAGIWIVWWNLLLPAKQRIEWLVHYYNEILPPDFLPPEHQYGQCLIAITVALLWLISLRLKKTSPLDTARIFFTGLVLIWCTTNSLLLPWINETKSFRTVITQLEEFIHTTPYSNQCMGNYNLGENMAPMLEYMMKLEAPLPIIQLNDRTCPLIIHFALRDSPIDIDPHWKMVWRGTRLLDIKSNELRLYELH